MKMSMQEIVEYIGRHGCLPPGACGPTKAACGDLVNEKTAMLARAANRTVYYGGPGEDIDIADLAAGANVSEAIPSNGLWRCVYITDITGSGLPATTELDALRISLEVSGNVLVTFNGGRFARGNANDCVSACGVMVCVGPVEALTIRVTNITAAALGATAAVSIETRTVYSGEEGFCCEGGSCSTPLSAVCGTEVG